MSQVSIIDIEGNHPQIPTQFNANIDSAIPIGNQLNIYGTTVAAGSVPLQSRGSGNTITLEIQRSQAIGTTNAANAGVASFNSAQFTVDANGFVSLNGGGAAIDSVQVDAFTAPGTNPVLPDVNGLITVTGAQVASGVVGANVIRSNSIAANAYRMEIQRSIANATADSSLNGVSHYNSAHFSVDADGFVSLTGGGQAIDSFTTDVSGPVSPDGAGNVAFTGATNIYSDGSVANTMRLNLQGTDHALYVGRGTNQPSASLGVGTNGQVLIAATGADPAFATITSPDGSITFTPGANTLAMQVAGGTTTGKTITGNSGVALSPTAGNWNIPGNNTALNGFASYSTGSGSTLTINSFGRNKWVVNPVAGIGTHTTIQAAITAASAGDTVVITANANPYIENITGKSGVNIVADVADKENNVIISGTITHNTAGIFSISGIRLQTNGAAFLAVTGSAASSVYLNNCYFNCTDSTGITFSSSNASALINISNCSGNLGTTGIALFSSSSAGRLKISNTEIFNTGSSTTANTSSAGFLDIQQLYIQNPITTSGTAGISAEFLFSVLTNTTALTINGSGNNSVVLSSLNSGSASALSVGSALRIGNCSISSTNTNAITGSGTISYTSLGFIGTSSLMNTSVLDGLASNSGSISFDGGTNKLSNYTEGTWTPTLTGGTTAGVTTYTSQNGYYTRIGNLVTVQFTVGYSAATGTGIKILGGLPFTVKNQTGGQFQGSCTIENATTWPAGTTNVSVNGLINTNTAKFFCCGSGAASGSMAIANIVQVIVGTLTYQI